MTNFLNQFLLVIQNSSVDNTYKMAWARAIVELSINRTEPRIYLEEIAKVMLRNYWNQTIFFDLVQGSNPSKPPEFIKKVKYLINSFYVIQGTQIPKRFELVEHLLDINYKKLVSILKRDVSWRFLNLGNEKAELYFYEQGADFILLENIQVLAQNSSLLFDSINFRWTQILEQFNTSPRVAKKVKSMDLGESIRRKSLRPFWPYLDVTNSKRICFICRNPIHEDQLSIDHVIPWSFMYSDDLWNLVYAHKGCNSQKLNVIPSQLDIERLNSRNEKLLKQLKQTELANKKHTHELELAINQNYVEKFWISAK
ncbi:HNH endonuclease signature motif containing protein [Pseudoalteromonas sp. S2721]|uniref:HNH endonuclease n=1 Tax=Pseudoalteromonas sp. S2721 TaxID=579526 RepID=UPI001BB104CE|nr:HNH endonuclease signature motif containing protein [Pseudoalteromonas sp. S2721]